MTGRPDPTASPAPAPRTDPAAGTEPAARLDPSSRSAPTSVAAVVGIDIGGSKTHGVLSRGGTVLAESVQGAANPSSVGVAEAARQLDALVADLTAAAPGGQPEVAAVCVGAAGIESDDAVDRLDLLVSERFPGVPVRVVHDTALVLAAAGLDAGLVVISGTGSAAWGRTAAGEQARAGGWGYVLGDAGSGYGLARAAVRHVLDRADEGLVPDPLTATLLGACGVDSPAQLLDLFYAAPERRTWAARAGAVVALAEAGDADAVGLVDDTAAELVQAVTRVGRRLGLTGPVVLAGGLVVHQPLLQATVADQLATAGLSDVRVLDTAPVHGAVALAAALAAGSTGP